MRYTLRQLEVFLAVAHCQNITRAAHSLSMSQSAASGALKDFETQFDIQLFDRVGKRLQINELGRLIRPRVEALMARAEELQTVLSEHDDVGTLKVGATLSIGNYLAVGLMAEFMALYRHSTVSLHVANTSVIAEKVRNFEIDVGLVEGELSEPELDVMPWRDDELTVFCAPQHPLAGRQSLSDQELIDAIWIMREEGSGTRQIFERAMEGVLPQFKVGLELQHTEAIKRAVEAQLGIACLSKVTLDDAFARGSLVPLAVPHRNLKRKFYIVLHKQKYRSAGIQRWLELCHGTEL